MRILQISSAEQFGGGERHFVDLCRSLAAAGHEVSAALRPQSPLPELLGPQIRIHKLPLRGAVDLFSAYGLAELISKTRSEIVHAHYARDYPIAALAVKYSRYKGAGKKSAPGLPAFFITRHHYLPLKSNWAYKRLLGSLDCAVAVSESVRNTLIQSFSSIEPDPQSPTPDPRPLFPIAVIPNWIDPNELALSDSDRDKCRSEFGLKPESAAIGAINQIGEAKGQATLLRAAALLSDRKDLQILIAGREHDPSERYTKYLRRLAEESGLAERTVFAGHVARLPQLLASLDLVAIPSENEAFSIVCLEAMSARRPVIASAVGGLAEIIEDGKTGLLFPAGDARALADRIEQALGSPALCRMLTEAAYRSVESRFSRAAQIEKIVKLYGDAIERRTANGERRTGRN